MAVPVLLACGLASSPIALSPPPPFTFVRTATNGDGSFLISCLLSHRLRLPNNTTILCTIHQSFTHYMSVGARLGNNLSTALEKGCIRLVEPIRSIAENNFDSPYLQENIIDNFVREIDAQLKLLPENSARTIIVDDLLALEHLGVTATELCRFILQLRQRVDQNRNLSVVVKLNASETVEEIAAQLEHVCDVELQVEGLKSGLSKEVDGRLTVIDKTKGPWQAADTKTVLYKLAERNVKIFLPGEVGIKH